MARAYQTMEEKAKSPVETVESFYSASARRDHEGMAACYHPAVRFSDPVFHNLYGDGARAMWRMLGKQGTELSVPFGHITAEGERGTAHWEARYTFPPTGRFVHNKIDASFEFLGRNISRHIDDFNLWQWTRMALGVRGALTDWTRFTQGKVRKTAFRELKRFMDKHPEYNQQDLT